MGVVPTKKNYAPFREPRRLRPSTVLKVIFRMTNCHARSRRRTYSFGRRARKGWACIHRSNGSRAPSHCDPEGGIADFLFDEKRNPGKPATGWAVDVDSPEQIALAVKDIITNPEKVTRIRDNALNLVREKYDWNLVAQNMNSLLERI